MEAEAKQHDLDENATPLNELRMGSADGSDFSEEHLEESEQNMNIAIVV